MKHTRHALVLALSLLLTLSLLAGCGDEKEKTDGVSADAGSTATEPPEKDLPDPGETASAAIEATFTELADRMNRSPLGTVLTLLGSENLALDFSVGVPDEQGEVSATVAGNMALNKSSGCALFDGTLSSPGGEGEDALSIPLKLWYSPEFMGVSSPLFRDEVFYGVAPENMASQLEGSAFARLFSLDTASLSEADRFLSTIPGNVGVYKAGFLEGVQSSLAGLMKYRALDMAEVNILRGGQSLSGYTVTVRLSGEEMAGLLEDVTNLLPEGVLLYGLVSDSGQVLTLKDKLEQIREEAVPTAIELTVADGKLYHLSTAYTLDGVEHPVEAEFYGEDGRTVSVSVDPVFSFNLTLDGGVRFDMRTVSDTPTITTLTWDSAGGFEFITYTADVTDLCLEGTASAENGVLTYGGIWYSGERGDRNPLSLTAGIGSQIVAPTEFRNVAELDQREIYSLAASLIFSGLFDSAG